ncbi:hypothetical protein VAFE106499_10260 [Vagococcus fessus]
MGFAYTKWMKPNDGVTSVAMILEKMTSFRLA